MRLISLSVENFRSIKERKHTCIIKQYLEFDEMNIGELHSTTPDEKEELEGSVETLNLDMKFRMKLCNELRGESSPNYDIYTRSKATGREVRVVSDVSAFGTN